ncbi:alpha/beta fold hydrolase (plasmid) [Mycolicibacterium fluoranthenivorans]|uniref:Alpha/beta fold hydrolase n=1 Tax=Mycolicibacterium fluoranthenivorans TaxID=258505 RepID=A0A7G8PQC5_9MYCO|nr:alpha/beta hydrolase [Mycolicibacterium fluoranthenivorans]QNJ96541.1 alpha/beta fold hydrolase [Mycolicibacterium fluoranthenivorans]
MELSIGGLRVAARATGSGEPVLLLNGMSRPMESWAYFADALQDRTVVAFDAPGVGASETPVVPYSMPMLADIAARVLDAVGVEKADVVGYSHGGAVAQQFAVGHRTRVNRLVLLATACGVGAVPGHPRDLTRLLLTPNRETRWPRPDPLGLLWQIAAISTWSSIPVLGCIDAPALVICGEHDRAVPPANSRLLAARIRDARFVTVQAGHDLQKPAPAATVGRLVECFLSEKARDPRDNDAAGQMRVVN